MAADPHFGRGFVQETMADIEAKYPPSYKDRPVAKDDRDERLICDVSGVFANIIDERISQDNKWGGSLHDDAHNPSDWLGFLQTKIDQADHDLGEVYRRRMVQIAALAVAAVESFDRQSNMSADFVEANPAALEAVRKKFAGKLHAQHPDHPWLTEGSPYAQYVAAEQKDAPALPGVPEITGL